MTCANDDDPGLARIVRVRPLAAARLGVPPPACGGEWRSSEDVKGQAASGSNREGESTEAGRRGGAARSSDEGPVMGLERRGCVVQPWPLANWKREEPVDEAKPFKIPKREVWEAFKRVKANERAAGVDGQSIAEFEANLTGNLYKLWNRLSSGSYFPPPVRRVDIPKANGGTRRCSPEASPVLVKIHDDEPLSHIGLAGQHSHAGGDGTGHHSELIRMVNQITKFVCLSAGGRWIRTSGSARRSASILGTG
jgi:hypothetical protein